MSTRANFLIVTTQGKFKFQANSSAYPERILPDIFQLLQDSAYKRQSNLMYDIDCGGLSKLIDNCSMILGEVGNPSYYYHINMVEKTVKCWDNKLGWTYAPKEWKEKGYHCYIGGKRNEYGYHTWKHGKLLYSKTFQDIINEETLLINKAEIELAATL